MTNAREVIDLEISRAREQGEDVPPSDAEHVVIGTATIHAA
jgi:predicted RNase H-like HicB family nuclease